MPNVSALIFLLVDSQLRKVCCLRFVPIQAAEYELALQRALGCPPQALLTLIAVRFGSLPLDRISGS